ncbi:MAG TPA: NAD(+) diphosphatase [Cellulomonadaceae bacterium]|nr:NAD(+) diphosphatase [Cellulomonadaceae bacterium]
MEWSDLPLSRATIDRASARRNEPGLLGRLVDDARTRVVLVRRGLVTTVAGAVVRLAVLPPHAVLPVVGPSPEWLLLGMDDDGAAYLGLHVPEAEAQADLEGVPAADPFAEIAPDLVWSPLREIGTDLSPQDVGLATTAVALAAWHAGHPRCPRCGSSTTVEESGWVRRCPQDGSLHYPRTDPAVIMAVTDADDRVLLGHAAPWSPGRFSTLAGYVEPGEPLEQAVRREVREEVGVLVGDVEYVSSQPWPFPASLMLGFRGRALTTELTVDGIEVTEARWFTRHALADAVRSAEVVLPSRTSIARALIEDWFGGPLTGPVAGPGWSEGR